MYPTHITSHKNKSVNDKDILTRKSRTVRVSSVVLWVVDTLDGHLTRKSTACGRGRRVSLSLSSPAGHSTRESCFIHR